jgi:prolyl-tRNA synthetase
VAVESAAERIKGLLDEIQTALLTRARAFLASNIHDVKSYDELLEVVTTGGWARGWWAGSDGDETRIKEDTGATIRCFPFEQPPGPGTCFLTEKPASEVAIFAKAY